MKSTKPPKPIRIEPRPEFASILRDEPFAVRARGTPGAGSGAAERINRAFDRLVLQSGTRLSGAVVLRLCLLCALICGGSVFVFSENLLATGLATSVGAFLLVAELLVRRSQRRARFSEQFPAVVERLLRATRAGSGLATSFEQVARRTPTPLGDELQSALRRRQLGMEFAEALQELPERTGLAGMSALVTTIRLAERQGRDPVECLELLSESLQERDRHARQRHDATALDWASGVLVFLLQALVVWLFVVADPHEMSRMATSRATVALAAAAGTILIAGWYCLLRLSAGRRSVT
jgi:tight adherence protein B